MGNVYGCGVYLTLLVSGIIIYFIMKSELSKVMLRWVYIVVTPWDNDKNFFFGIAVMV